MHRHRFDDFQHHGMGFDFGLERQDVFQRPDLAHRHVIDGRDDAMHAGDLTDIGQRHRIVIAIPAERHLHGLASWIDAVTGAYLAHRGRNSRHLLHRHA